MSRSGHHRIRSFARWLATPILLVGVAMVAFAVWQGDVPILRMAAIGSVITGLIAVALFDYELIRNRRDHGAERAMQAKAYIDLYTQRLREHLHATAVPVPRLPEEEAEPSAGPVADAWVVPVRPGRVDDVSQAPELWDDQDDAPTVVDLIAYEVRARLAEDERRALAEERANEPKAASG